MLLKTLDKRVKFATLSALLVLAVLNYYNTTYINSLHMLFTWTEEIGYVAAEELVEVYGQCMRKRRQNSDTT